MTAKVINYGFWTQETPTEEGSYGIGFFESNPAVTWVIEVEVDEENEEELGCYTHEGWQPLSDFNSNAWWCRIELPSKPVEAK